ncbi:N-acetylneuraminate synthase family protein [Planctomycetota bacterium]
MDKISIGKRNIGFDEQVYFIADIAANHDGELSRAKDLIYLAAESGADAAKFQHFTADTIVSDYGFKLLGGQIAHQEKWDKSVVEIYRAASIDLNWTRILKDTCDEAGITFLTSPYSIELVDSVDEFIPAYKIGSGDITWHSILHHIASKGKPILLATGAATLDEVKLAVSILLEKNKKLILMQCNTNYTNSAENFKHINLRVLQTYRNMFPGLPLGLSDHTSGHATVLGAVSLGACVIEKHFTDDTKRKGPDHVFSMDPQSWHDMVDRARELQLALGDGVKRIEENEKESAVVQKRALRYARPMSKGSTVSDSDLLSLRPIPEGGLPPYKIDVVRKKKLQKDVVAGDCVCIKDFEVC